MQMSMRFSKKTSEASRSGGDTGPGEYTPLGSHYLAPAIIAVGNQSQYCQMFPVFRRIRKSELAYENI